MLTPDSPLLSDPHLQRRMTSKKHFTISAVSKKALAAAGISHDYLLCTQRLLAHRSATSASVLQHGSSFHCKSPTASKQSAMCHINSSASSLSNTTSAMLQSVRALLPCQVSTSSAARWQGTCSNTIQGSLVCPTQPAASAQLAQPQGSANGYHWQHGSGQASLLPDFWHTPGMICQLLL